MINKLIKLCVFITLATTCGFSQVKDSTKVKGITNLEEVVISDTKFSQKKEKSGKVITTITQEEIQKKAGQTLAMVLNSAVGVEINGSESANGKNLGYYIRGGKNQQVLIMIDGNPVTDASGISFEYDLRLLPIDQVESIEIMKGAASVLYGTGAATAVINITLKKSFQKPINATAYINIGSNNTSNNHKYNGQDFNQGFSVGGTTKKVNYLIALNSTETGGMSQIAAPENQIYENDRFSRINYMSKIGFKATKKLSLDFFGNYDKIDNDYDVDFDNTGFDDTKFNKSITKQARVGFSPKYIYKKGAFILNSSFAKLERNYQEFYSWGNTNYSSQNINLDAFNKYQFNANFYVITGINYQFYDMATTTSSGNLSKENTKFNVLDPYFTAVYNSNFGLNINFGARLNTHSQYGTHWVYNFNPSYNLNKNLKIITSISTAFVSPSLYQLYSPYGNLNLTSQENKTIETGLDLNLFNKKLNFNTVGFYREENNSIVFTASHYTNIDGINKAKGIETALNYAVTNQIKLNANYTFTQVDEALNLLIPKHKANISVDYSASKRWFLNANYQYIDGKNDAFYDGTVYDVVHSKLGSYQLCNFLTKYELIKNTMTIFGTITNIFNENFVENTGYSTRGRNFKLGINFNF